ncbi:MAG: glycosyltransferase family 39 protein [Alphaproteobacteria bacterium]|nr:glycosyltransferase family 39 protein [Alphaproteobacteria bacterium]
MSGAATLRRLALPAIVLLAAAWRLFLGSRYYGWEESDYGNLAMVRGVLEGHFLHYDMNHMPGYYGAAALLLAVVGDTVLAAKATSFLAGLAALFLAFRLVERLAGPAVATAAGLLLVFQPEFALYASTSLREPIYAMWLLGALTALSRERLALAGLLGGMAFLVRFDGALVVGPVLALHALGRGPRLPRLLRAGLPLLGIIGLYATYTWIDHGTPFFWSHAVAVNVETGLGEEATSQGQWVANGFRVAGTLVAWLLPWRIGWGVWLGLFVTLATTPWLRHGLARTWVVLGLAMLGVWAGIGFTGQHDPGHNLYWKWLCPIVPVIVPLGVVGLFRAAGRLPGAARGGLIVLCLLQAGASHLKETHRQLDLSARWYGPQVELARWIEDEVDPEVPLLVDNIPACWIDRRPHDRTLHSWFDVPVPDGDPAAFSAWLRQERIGWVLWFREDWTQAPTAAPFLAEGGTWRGEGLTLVETAREDGYGWIMYRVDPAGEGTGLPAAP